VSLLRVKVRLFGSFREMAGKGEIEIPLSGYKDPITVRDVIEALGREVGEEISRKILDSWRQFSSLLILVNGRNIRFMQKLDTAVKDGDEVAIFPPGAGG